MEAGLDTGLKAVNASVPLVPPSVSYLDSALTESLAPKQQRRLPGLKAPQTGPPGADLSVGQVLLGSVVLAVVVVAVPGRESSPAQVSLYPAVLACLPSVPASVSSP